MKLIPSTRYNVPNVVQARNRALENLKGFSSKTCRPGYYIIDADNWTSFIATYNNVVEIAYD